MRLKRGPGHVRRQENPLCNTGVIYFLSFLAGILLPILIYGGQPAQPAVYKVPYDIVDNQPSETATKSEAASTPAVSSEPEKPKCTKERKPYHVLLTSMSTTYLDWQARIMYYHFLKQQKNDPCNEMTGFTRLVANDGGQPDKLDSIMPSVYVPEISHEDLHTKYKAYAVLNRPVSVEIFVNTPELFDRITEDYVFLAECDHLFLQPIPNDATENTAVGFPFGYMRPNPGFNNLIRKHWPAGDSTQVDQVGPSPLIIHKKALKKVAKPWRDFSLALKIDPESDQKFGWVLEMWGYAIAAGSVGIKHKLLRHFQCEPGSASRMSRDYTNNFYIHHYTYGTEYDMSGRPMLNTIGEWSLDKRHYGGSYPPRNLQPPPTTNNAGDNYAATWLLEAWNEASAADELWPTSAYNMGTIGWRRNKLSDADAQDKRVAQLISSGKTFTWANIPGLEFRAGGTLKTPWGYGDWGVLHGQVTGEDCDAKLCLNADFSNSLHNVFLGEDLLSFRSLRVGDGEVVEGRTV